MTIEMLSPLYDGPMHSTFASHMKCICAISALLLALAAGPAAAQDLKAWRHGVIEAKSDAGFMLMASRRGFAEKQGLKIDVLQVKSDTIGLKALLAGELDSYEGGPGGAIVAASRGADIKILGCHWPTLVHGVFVRETVANVQGLKGKAFAISAPGAMPDLLARAVLEKYGMAPSDVRFANLGSDLDRFKALSAGVVDAGVVSTEYLPVAPKDIRLLFAARDVMPNFIRICFVTSGKVLSERRDDAVRFVASEIAALRFAVAHRDETLALTREVTKTKDDDPRPGFIFDEAVKYKDVDPEVPLSLDKLEWMKAALSKTTNLPPFDLAKLVDADVRAKALTLLGK
jgi:NitT/TauT family transport system substrate-binding protein